MKEFDPYDRLNRGARDRQHRFDQLGAASSVRAPDKVRPSLMDDPAVAVALAMAMRAICIHRGPGFRIRSFDCLVAMSRQAIRPVRW